MKNLLFFTLSTFLFASCGALIGDEIGRLPFDQLSTDSLQIKQITLDLKKDDQLTFWTEMDLEYEGEIDLAYTVELWNDTIKVGGFYLDPLNTNPTMMAVKTEINNKTNWSYKGKMDFLKMTEDGKYTIKAVIKSNEAEKINLKKADLVVRK